MSAGDFEGAGFVGAASSRDLVFKANSFRGWKPLPREVDTCLVLSYHIIITKYFFRISTDCNFNREKEQKLGALSIS